MSQKRLTFHLQSEIDFVSTAISSVMIALAKRQREEKAGNAINFASNEIHQPPRNSTSVFAREDSRGKRTQDDNEIERKRKWKTRRHCGKRGTIKVSRYAEEISRYHFTGSSLEKAPGKEKILTDEKGKRRY